MNTQIFYIKSILVQNTIMILFTAILLSLLIWALKNRSRKLMLAVGVWTVLVLWFFNSSLWGFSAVTVGPDRLKLHYGILSVLKNTDLPVETPWKIKTYMGGVRKIKTLYYINLAGHNSIKVRGREGLVILQEIGRAIDRVNGHPMGTSEPRLQK